MYGFNPNTLHVEGGSELLELVYLLTGPDQADLNTYFWVCKPIYSLASMLYPEGSSAVYRRKHLGRLSTFSISTSTDSLNGLVMVYSHHEAYKVWLQTYTLRGINTLKSPVTKRDLEGKKPQGS